MDMLADHLRSFEEALLHPAVRRNRRQVDTLLSEEFQEFGSSGTVWSRDQIFDLLANETFTPVSIEDFHCALLSEAVALATYRAVRTDKDTGKEIRTLRSSIWIKESETWRLRFHQGTRT